MTEENPNVNELKAKLDELAQQVQSMAQEKGRQISNKSESMLADLKSELARRAAQTEASPLQAALAALAVGLIQEFEPAVKQSAQAVGEKTAGFVENVRKDAGQALEAAGQASKRAEQGVRDYVKENPWKSLALVAVLGFVLGKALSDKQKSGGELQ